MKEWPFVRDRFQASWCWIGYDDYEIFEATDAEFEALARRLREAGFTHLGTGSWTHFRWSFRREFPQMLTMLKRLTAACHKYGLYVIEHHSANLIFTPDNAKDVEEIRNFRPGAFEEKNWPKFFDDMPLDSLIGNVELGSMLQISGLTGESFRSIFGITKMLCHNNPDYLRMYFAYLEALYACNIDGIMTDDIQFISEPLPPDPDHDYDVNSCACPHCRRLFKEASGFDLPEPGEAWEKFQKETDEIIYLEWRKFRYDTTKAFHQKVVDHYTRLGLKMWRPNYAASTFSWACPWAVVFEELPALDLCFSEQVCGINRYSWPEYCVEDWNRLMIGRKRDIPCASLYYPTHKDDRRFCRGLSILHNHRTFVLGPSVRTQEIEPTFEMAKYNEFERTAIKDLFDQESIARIAFYDSYLNREFDPEQNNALRKFKNSWTQAALRHNIPMAMVNCQNPEEFSNYDVIISAGAPWMSDSEIQALGSYVRHGGRLLWGVKGGTRRLEDWGHRTSEQIAWLLQLDKPVVNGEEQYSGCGSILGIDYDTMSAPFVKRAYAYETDPKERYPHNCSENSRWQPLDEAELLHVKATALFIEQQLSDNDGGLKITDCPQDLLGDVWYNKTTKAMTLRLVNAVDTLKENAPEPGFGPKDPLPFVKLERMFEARIRKPEKCLTQKYTVAHAYAVDSESLETLKNPVEVTDADTHIIVRFNGELLNDFLVIDIG